MSIYNQPQFKPTWLYIKQHNKTKLKYFGKTTRNPKWYQGSGKYWKRHLKRHGSKNCVITIWCKLFTEQNKLTRFARLFSRLNKIVESELWANLKEENGLDGGNYGTHSSYTIEKIRAANIGRKRTAESIEKTRIGNTGIIRTEEFKNHLKEMRKGKSRPSKICPYCNLECNIGNLSRHILAKHGLGTNKKGKPRLKKECPHCLSMISVGNIKQHIRTKHKPL